MKFIKSFFCMIFVKNENENLKNDRNYQEFLLRQEITRAQIQRKVY